VIEIFIHCIVLICIMLCFWCRWCALSCDDHLRCIMSSFHLFFWLTKCFPGLLWDIRLWVHRQCKEMKYAADIFFGHTCICSSSCYSHTSGISVSVTDKHRHDNYNKIFLTEIIIIIYRVGQQKVSQYWFLNNICQ